jgi:hypothetical protein
VDHFRTTRQEKREQQVKGNRARHRAVEFFQSAFRLVLLTFALREPALAQYFLLTGLDVMDALAMTATLRLHFCHRRERITARGRSKDIERGILVGLPMQSASGVLLFAVEGFTITAHLPTVCNPASPACCDPALPIHITSQRTESMSFTTTSTS